MKLREESMKRPANPRTVRSGRWRPGHRWLKWMKQAKPLQPQAFRPELQAFPLQPQVFPLQPQAFPLQPQALPLQRATSRMP
jgi:hypothetical protein